MNLLDAIERRVLMINRKALAANALLWGTIAVVVLLFNLYR